MSEEEISKIDSENLLQKSTVMDDDNINNLGNTTIDKKSIKRNEILEEKIKKIMDENKDISESLKCILKEIFIVAIPTSLFFVVLFIQQSINLAFISREYKNEIERKQVIDGIGITHVYLNCTVISIAIGLISAFEVLGGNAMGQNNKKLLGIYMHRAQIIGFLVMLVISIIHFFTATIVLSKFGINSVVVEKIREYLTFALYIGFFDVQFHLNFRYINIIEKTYVNLIISFLVIALHPLWCYLFISLCELKIYGAGLTLLISQAINAFGGCFYIFIIKPDPESIFCYTRESFSLQGLKNYCKIGIPNAFLMCAEWWAFEILAIISLWCSDVDYTTHVLVLNQYAILFTLLIGNNIACSILTSKYLGEGKTNVAKQTIKIVTIVNFISALILSSLIAILRKYIIGIYLSEKDKEYTLACNTLIIIILSLTLDTNQSLLAGACRGLRLQLQATIICFISFYIFSDGFAIGVGKYAGWGVYGVWASLAFSGLVGSILYTILLYNVDFEKATYETLKEVLTDGGDILRKSTSSFSSGSKII